MPAAASLSLLVAIAPVPAPQQPPSDRPPILSAQEQASLRNKLRKYLFDDDAHYEASERDREKLGKAREKSKEAFETEWAKLEKKGNLMGSMVDLRAVLGNCFTRKRPTHSLGQLQKRSLKRDQIDFSVYIPKAYKAEEPWPTVVVLPGLAGSPGQWTKGPEYFESVWDKTPLAELAIIVTAQLEGGLEMDPVPDYSRDGAETDEDRRIRTVLLPLGDTMGEYNVDRTRIFLDCGNGTCGFGLRLATLFPDRFAGIVLRAPTAVDGIRLGSLRSVPVLLLRTEGNAAAVDALQQQLEAVAPGMVTVIAVTDPVPHRGAAGAIQQWMQDKQRNMSPTRVVLEPNHDRFNQAYWVQIETADSIWTAAAGRKPRLDVEADPAANRITVKAVGVDSFTLCLNDDLVDLDREFTVVVNDKATVEKRTRSFREMLKRMLKRNDWDYLFPVRISMSVARE